MEAKSSSATEEIRRAGDDDEVSYELYSPCYYLHLFMKSLLNYLGFTEKHTSSTIEEADKEEEEGAIIYESDRSLPLHLRKPTRPPVSTGGGSQVN